MNLQQIAKELKERAKQKDRRGILELLKERSLLYTPQTEQGVLLRKQRDELKAKVKKW